METAVRWSPSSTLFEQRFLIVDVKERSFKRCAVKQYDGNLLKHETISTYSKVPGFRAFDWAPHDENLVAVGSWSGEVTVLHLDDTLPNVSFPAKRQRLCNAVAFSKTGFLAAGLEGVRNDFCLNLWDISQRSPAVTSPGIGISKPFVEPYRRFASSEAISSIKFFSGQPDCFVSGIKGKGVRVYDLRERSGNPSLIFRTECVYNIAVDPLDEHYFACAGPPDDRRIQIWDSRLGTSFSAAATGSSLDLIGQTERPVLEFRDVFKSQKASLKRFDGTGVMISTIWSLRYCKGKDGCLGALASTGDFKVFETKHGFTSTTGQHDVQGHLSQNLQNSEHNSLMTKRIHQVERAYDDVRQSRAETDRIVAFDFTNLASTKGAPTAIILRGDHSVHIIELDGPPSALSVSSLGDLIVSKPNEAVSLPAESDAPTAFLNNAIRRIEVREVGTIADDLLGLRDRKAHFASAAAETQKISQDPLSSRQKHERLLEVGSMKSKPSLSDALILFSTTRRRCHEDYIFNVKENIDILRDDPWLQSVWHWIDCKNLEAFRDAIAQSH